MLKAVHMKICRKDSFVKGLLTKIFKMFNQTKKCSMNNKECEK